jgi:hypothetical protein
MKRFYLLKLKKYKQFSPNTKSRLKRLGKCYGKSDPTMLLLLNQVEFIENFENWLKNSSSLGNTY